MLLVVYYIITLAICYRRYDHVPESGRECPLSCGNINGMYLSRSLRLGKSGSIPLQGANYGGKVFMDARLIVNHLEWDRYPLPLPI